MLLFSRIGALTYVPSSSTTVPPPLPAEHSSTAFWIAAVSLVVPSPFAPYFFASQTLPAAIAGTADIANITATATTHSLASIFILSPVANLHAQHLTPLVQPPATPYISQEKARPNSWPRPRICGARTTDPT